MTTQVIDKHLLKIPIGNVTLDGNLTIPSFPKGLIIFSHGSGSSRLSARNRMVAEKINDNGFATLLFDLLTEEEDRIYANRFNIPLLSDRLLLVTKWMKSQPFHTGYGLGYFGASTGAASAFFAAAELGKSVQAVVARGGRPDLALAIAGKITAPTLLLVGSMDKVVLECNETFFDQLNCTKKLQVIQGASHLFEEKGKLEEVAEAAKDWFTKYLI